MNPVTENNYAEKSKELIRFYQRVIDWNKTAGTSYDNPKNITLYKKLVREEISEILQAFEKGDAVEYVKEIVDGLVVTSYYSLCCGMPEDELLDVSETDELSVSREFLGYTTTYDLYNVFDKHGSDVLLMLEDFYFTTDADMASIAHEVMDSNFSKFMPVSVAVSMYNGDLSGVCKEIEESSKGRYKNITSQESNGYIIFRDEGGKIVKPPCYRKANVSQFVPSRYH